MSCYYRQHENTTVTIPKYVVESSAGITYYDIKVLIKLMKTSFTYYTIITVRKKGSHWNRGMVCRATLSRFCSAPRKARRGSIDQQKAVATKEGTPTEIKRL